MESAPLLRQRPIKRVEYEKLTEQGFFDSDERLELLDGLLVFREPQYAPHATAVRLAATALRRAFGPGWVVEGQLPIALDDVSEPEPDVAVVPGDPRDYRDGHPERPVLILEVAESSLAKDRDVKLALYARAGITDYWIVNLIDRVLEVYREPVWSPSSPHGWRYASLVIARPPEGITPLAAPHSRVAVADLLP
ncbi:MAG: Uma2 family endonuclease [Candidatus Rokubacteria bacterium]|nr:Uma2 family endonuclease [Candidatus Rokubacteria bacterium]